MDLLLALASGIAPRALVAYHCREALKPNVFRRVVFHFYAKAEIVDVNPLLAAIQGSLARESFLELPKSHHVDVFYPLSETRKAGRYQFLPRIFGASTA